MSYFTIIEGLPVLDLQQELNRLVADNLLSWHDGKNQICLNTIAGCEDDYILGTGSLTHDWENGVVVVDEYGNQKTIIKEKETRLHEHDFKILCNQFKGTLFETVYNQLDMRYNLGRVRLMKSKSKTCLSWHTDAQTRIHFPIKTQEGCFMVIGDEVKHLSANTWWRTETKNVHTAFNSSKEDRIHLVAVILE